MEEGEEIYIYIYNYVGLIKNLITLFYKIKYQDKDTYKLNVFRFICDF